MQVGLFEGQPPRYDAERVTQRINTLTRAVRAAGGTVIFIQHDEPRGALKPGTDGWQILSSLERTDIDPVVNKQACEAFYETELAEVLAGLGAQPLIVTGCATDIYVDTTIRAAASWDYKVLVVVDGHTTRDRPHLEAEAIIQHHNWMWKNLILPRSRVQVLATERIIDQM